MEKLLHRQTCVEILTFVQGAMIELRWSPGYDQADIQRYERVKHISWMANILLNETDYVLQCHRDPTPMEAALTTLIVEIAEHTREAIQNRTLRANQFESYAVMAPFEADAEYRRMDMMLAAA